MDHTARINWVVLVTSSVVILAFSIWASFTPDDARTTMKTLVDWIAMNLGRYYVLTMTCVIGFVVWVAFSKEGDVRLGPDHSRPQYKLVTWVAMLFAAGVGIDMLFFSVTGPIVQYLHPPSGAGGTSAALQIALVIGAVVLTIAATTSGVDRGIRWISELNLWSALAMMVYILVTGQTAFLLNALVENIGRFIVIFPERALQTFAYEPGVAEWMCGWTLFFWAFWFAWGPFVGVFLARISRGRTLREFVIAAITAPVLCDFIIVSLFGNSALYHVLQGNTEFAELAVRSPEQGWYGLLQMCPGATFLIGLATLSGLLFYLTSANSGAIVTANFSASIPDPSQDGPKWLRVFRAVLTAVLTVAMLLAGGVTTMEYATLIFALPVTLIAFLVMASFYKVLRMERAEREGQVLRRRSMAPSGGHVPERSWKQRLEVFTQTGSGGYDLMGLTKQQVIDDELDRTPITRLL